MEVSTIGWDLAKNVFQAHRRRPGRLPSEEGCDATKCSRSLRISPRCLVAMEVCASSHYWGREIGKLGHEVRLIPPAYVKPFVKRQKNDMADAEAICEAAQRSAMRKSVGGGGTPRGPIPLCPEERQARCGANGVVHFIRLLAPTCRTNSDKPLPPFRQPQFEVCYGATSESRQAFGEGCALDGLLLALRSDVTREFCRLPSRESDNLARVVPEGACRRRPSTVSTKL
jgi:hypothetical protein